MRSEGGTEAGRRTEPQQDVLSLVKMHGCGNDYVFVDTVGGPGLPDGVDLPRLAVELADRRFGVGGDGMIVIGRALSGRLQMRMFNADGSEGAMCGNGLRCLAAYAYEQGYVGNPEFEVETMGGSVRPTITPAPGPQIRAASVAVNLGPPREVRPGLTLSITEGPAKGSYHGTYVSMGNPHFVIIVSRADLVDLAVVGPVLERHPVFPDRSNVEFVEVLARSRLRMRIWERGSGITMASGSGASASLVAAVTAGLARRTATIVVDGGELEVRWFEDGPVVVSGPVVEVFRTVYRGTLPRMSAV